MLRIHAELAQSLGMDPSHTFVVNNGDSLVLSRGKVSIGYPVPSGNTYIDGRDINGLNESVIDDRKTLNEEGMLSIAIAIDPKTNELLLKPTFYVKGLINQGSPKQLEECRLLVEATIIELLKGKTNFAEIKQIIKAVAGEYLYKKTKKKPMIIPVVMSKVE